MKFPDFTHGPEWIPQGRPCSASSASFDNAFCESLLMGESCPPEKTTSVELLMNQHVTMV